VLTRCILAVVALLLVSGCAELNRDLQRLILSSADSR